MGVAKSIRNLEPVIGFALYWALMLGGINSEVLFPGVQGESHLDHALLIALVLSILFSILLCAVSFRELFKPLPMLFGGFLMSASCLFALRADESPLLLLQNVCYASGSIVLLAGWIEAFAIKHTPKNRIALPAGFFLGIAISAIYSLNDREIVLFVSILFPMLSAALLQRFSSSTWRPREENPWMVSYESDSALQIPPSITAFRRTLTPLVIPFVELFCVALGSTIVSEFSVVSYEQLSGENLFYLRYIASLVGAMGAFVGMTVLSRWRREIRLAVFLGAALALSASIVGPASALIGTSCLLALVEYLTVDTVMCVVETGGLSRRVCRFAIGVWSALYNAHILIGLLIGAAVLSVVHGETFVQNVVVITICFLLLTIALITYIQRLQVEQKTKRQDAVSLGADHLRITAEEVAKELAQANQLTPRECEVLTLMLEGNSDAGIAEILFLSKNTVKTHAANVYKKLNVHSREELLSIASR